jgi:phosphohistidine phosphatase SixA
MFMVLLRHAEKTTAPMDSDVPLTARGEKQALELVEQIRAQQLPQPTALMSSPKRRARATLQPLVTAFHIPLQIKTELDERASNESRLQFHKRIEYFVASLHDEVIYCCTHADWLYEAVMTLPHDMLDGEEDAHFFFAQARIFEQDGDLWRLRSPWKDRP